MKTRLKITLWFGASLVAIAFVTAVTADFHLRHELKVEKWERGQRGGQEWSLHGAYSDEEINDIVGELTHFWLMVAMPMLAVSLGVGYLLARKASEPVRALNRQLESIHLDTLERRIEAAGGEPEYQAIAKHVNALLARLEESFRNYREHSTRVAHELRTPLHALRLQVERAADHWTPELAASLTDELARLARLVDGLLTSARAEQGQLTAHVSTIAWHPYVEDFIETYGRLAEEEGRSLTVERKPGEMSVRSDEAQLRQILHNLLNNALRHGRGDILWQEHRHGPTLEVVIENAVKRPAESGGLGIGLRLATALAALQPSGSLEIEAGHDRFRVRLAIEIV